MSTIFDALKRSDRERQLNTTHTLSYSHLHDEKESSFAWLKYFLAVLILLACVALGVFFFTKNNAQSKNAEIASQTTQVESVPIESNAVLTEQSVLPKEVSSVPLESVDTINQVQVSEGPRQSLAQVAKKPIRAPAKVNSPAKKPTQETENPSVPINDLIEFDNYSSIKASRNLPDLHLDILKYHPNVTQRKVFINLKAYQEGESTAEGVKIVRISKQGVLLNYQGKDFVLNTN